MSGNLIPPDIVVADNFLLSILFGIYFVTLLFSYRWLFYTNDGWNFRPRRKINWILVHSTTLIFACNLVYLVLTMKSAVDIVKSINAGTTYVDPPWDTIVKCTAACVAKLCADAILLYRCWIVYGKRLNILVFPIIIWIIGCVCAILQIYLEVAHLKNPDITSRNWGPINMTIGPGIVMIPFTAATAIVNFYATWMLILRIYKITKKQEGIDVSSASARQFKLVIRMLAESGLLYLTTTLALFIAWFTPDTTAIQITSFINFPGLGIAFNLVIIRAAQQRAKATDMMMIQERGNFMNNTKVVSEIVFQERSDSSDKDTNIDQVHGQHTHKSPPLCQCGNEQGRHPYQV